MSLNANILLKRMQQNAEKSSFRAFASSSHHGNFPLKMLNNKTNNKVFEKSQKVLFFAVSKFM